MDMVLTIQLEVPPDALVICSSAKPGLRANEIISAATMGEPSTTYDSDLVLLHARQYTIQATTLVHQQ